MTIHPLPTRSDRAARAGMTDPYEIKSRMAYDIAYMRRNHGCFSIKEMLAFGWTREQILDYAEIAAAMLIEEKVA